MNNEAMKPYSDTTYRKMRFKAGTFEPECRAKIVIDPQTRRGKDLSHVKIRRSARGGNFMKIRGLERLDILIAQLTAIREAIDA